MSTKSLQWSYTTDMDSASTASYDYSQRKYLSKLMPKSQAGAIAITVAMAIVYPSTTGMESSIIGTVNSLDQYTEYFNINDKTLGLNSASTWIGYLLACPFVQQVCDYFGRKKTILAAVLIMYVGVALASAAQNTAMFVIGRIIIGIAGGLFGGAANSLVSELSPPKRRGMIVGIYHSCYYVGALIASGVTFATRFRPDEWAWRIPTLIQLVPVTVCLMIIPITPESPRWLILKGRDDHAREIFYVLNGGDIEKTEDVVASVKLEIEVEKASNTKGVYLRQFQTKPNLRRLAICMTLAWACELSGSSIATYYFSILLDSAGVTDVTTQLEVSIIRSAFCFVLALFGCYMFDILGRKKQALISMTGIIVFMFILGALVKVYGPSDNTSGQYGAIAMMFLFSGAYSFCFTPMLSLYPPEIFSNSSRLAGITIYHIFNYSTGLFCTFMLPIGMSNMGWKFYILTASYDVLFLPIIYFIWVETKQLSLEEIPVLFEGKKDLKTVQEVESFSDSMKKNDAKVTVESV